MSKNDPPPYSHSEPGFHVPPYGPPQPGYPQTQQPPIQTNVVVTHVSPVCFGPQPSAIVCSSCHAQITTTVETQATTKTHLFALLLCVFGCWLCCCIPYCVDSCQAQNHYCPNCKAYLGKFDN